MNLPGSYIGDDLLIRTPYTGLTIKGFDRMRVSMATYRGLSMRVVNEIFFK
jgi:hypothetical protein